MTNNDKITLDHIQADEYYIDAFAPLGEDYDEYLVTLEQVGDYWKVYGEKHNSYEVSSIIENGLSEAKSKDKQQAFQIAVNFANHMLKLEKREIELNKKYDIYEYSVPSDLEYYTHHGKDWYYYSDSVAKAYDDFLNGLNKEGHFEWPRDTDEVKYFAHRNDVISQSCNVVDVRYLVPKEENS